MPGNTTKADFKVFKAEVEKWIEAFGLYDWEVDIAHGGVSSDEHSAECQYQVDARRATIRLSEQFTCGGSFDANDLRQAARHEVGELLLARLVYLAENRCVTYEEIEEAHHDIIARLLNYLRRKP